MAAGYLPNTAPGAGTLLAQKYRVLRRIGEGGMGVVVEAEHTITGKRVAIKWMHPQIAALPDAIQRFLREARASARVRHPNVVDVYDVVQDADGVFLIMELLEGEPLSRLLDRGGVPAYEVIGLLIGAMRGVAAAHRQGVVHRDIKPDNIFLARDADRPVRTPKVLDFGISKLIDANERLTLTATGATLGTPLYMSYEQLCAAKDVDQRSDVYAFGVILYEALAGQPPYLAETFPELIVKIASQPPAPLRAVRPDIPLALEGLVARAMSRERERRPQSLDELIAALEPFATKNSFRACVTAERAAIAHEPAPNPSLLVEPRPSFPIGTPLQAEVPIPRPPRQRAVWPWLAAAAVCGAIAFATWWRIQPEAPGASAGIEPESGDSGPPSAAAEPKSTQGGRVVSAPSTGVGEPEPAPDRRAAVHALETGRSVAPAPTPGASRQAPPPGTSAAAQPSGAPPRGAVAPSPAAPVARGRIAPATRSGKPATPRGDEPAPDAVRDSTPRDVAAARVTPAAGAPAVTPEAIAQPRPEPEDERSFRAGRPRSQDF